MCLEKLSSLFILLINITNLLTKKIRLKKIMTSNISQSDQIIYSLYSIYKEIKGDKILSVCPPDRILKKETVTVSPMLFMSHD